MGIIGSIRKHSGWAVGIVGVAILAFILGDLTKNRGGVPDVGKVNGQTMTSQRFNELVADMENSYRMQQQTTQVPAAAEEQIREQVWQKFVDETLMGEQTSKLGLCVSNAELSDMYTGTFVHPYVRQSFTDPQTGQFDIRQVNYWIENFDQIDTMRRMQWVELEKYVRQDRENQKYSTLINSGFYMPRAIANKVAELSNTTANVRLVSLPFSSVKDEEVSLGEADYKSYYDENKNDFRVREELRDLEFIVFPVNPTPDDMKKIQEDVFKTWEEFQSVPDDEVAFFVNAESERKYDSLYVAANTFRAPFDEQIAAAKDGDMLAPVMVGNEWQMAKVLKSAVRPDSLRASWIIILNQNAGAGISRTNEQAKSLADSVLALVRSNKLSFDEAVQQYSDDPNKADNKGDLEWQLDGAYGFLNEKLVENPVGSCFVYEHPQGVGYYIVKVTDKTKAYKKYRVAMITREIVPSNATNRAVYNNANQFAGRNRTVAEFEASAQQENMQVRSARTNMMSNSLAGVSNARQIVQWAFNDDTKVGAVADQVYECDGMFVVVALKDVYKKGYATLDQVRTMIEQPVKLSKKGEMLIARANEAMTACGADINKIATKLNVAVDTLDSISFADYYMGRYGMEPKVQSLVAASEKGSTAGPVKGANGVYIIQVDSKAPRAVNADQVKSQLESGYRSKARALAQVLRDNAKITDQRNKFF